MTIDPANNHQLNKAIIGHKKKPKPPRIDPNSIQTRGWVRFIEAISEGPIEGLVDGGKSIYFDQTPLIAPDDQPNFVNLDWVFSNGLPDDAHFNGASAVETPVDVNVQVKFNSVPVTRTIVEENADAVRVILRVNALFSQTDKGDMHGAHLSYSIEVRGYEGSWQTALNNTIYEKSTSPFQIAHRIELPMGGNPWEIRVVRHTPDKNPQDDKVQNDLFFERYVILVEGKFTYPHTAGIFIEANAEDLGSSVPPRAYHVKGLQIQVPSNYDPVNRAYIGIWDGTFKVAWTNNPAWIFYDLLTNDRYGLGEFVSPAIVDKWSLYTIAQYCDQPVPSGYKNGDTGEDIYEPRFTFNGVINSRDEAYFVLQTITKAWRGMAYWALGQVFATSDMPSDPVKLVTPANIVKGEFEYSGTALKARHSVIMVKWNDPKDFYAPATEAVINDTLLEQYGWREKSLQLQGCTSRGLAHRYGKWILDSEQHETETVTYQAGWDHCDVRPGHIIAISDPNKANIRAGGRIKNHEGLTVVLDADFEATTGESYHLMLTMPDGTLETKLISAFESPNTVLLNEAFSQTAVDNAVWSIKGTDIHPRLFRVLAIKEEEPNIFSVTALFHDPHKYARIEHGIVFEPLPYDRPNKTSQPPTNLSVKETGYTSNGQTYHTLTVSWSPPEITIARGYIVSVDTPKGDYITLGITQELHKDFTNSETGVYKFYVQTVSYAGVISEPAEVEYEALGSLGFPLPTVTDLQLVDDPESTEFTGRDLNFRWTNNFAQQMEGIPESDLSPHYLANTLKIYNHQTNQLLRELKVTNNTYSYIYEANKADNIALGNPHACRQLRVEVVVHDIFGRTSEPAIVVFNNPPPLAIAPTPLVNAGTIYLYYEEPLDGDFVGVVVYLSKTPGIDVLTATPHYDGVANPVIILAEEDTTYYLKIAGYDTFGKDDLNYSSEVVVHTLFNVDMEAPDIPTGLAVNSFITDTGSRVVVTWDANTEDDLAGYDLQIKEPEGNWVSFMLVNNNYEFNSKPGLVYQFRLRSRDRMGNVSPYTPVVEHIAAKDNIPPAIPSNLTAMGGFGVIWLTWDQNDEYDFSHYEIYEAADEEPAPTSIAQPQYATAANSFVRSGLENNEKLYFWLRALDTSGNASEWTEAVTATTTAAPGVTEADLQGMVTKTAFAEGLVGIEVLATLPTEDNEEGRMVLNTTDGKLYRFVNGEWTASTSAEDISGALSASKIAIGDFTNIIDNGWVTGDISGWNLESNSTFALPSPAINADYYGYTVSSNGRVAASSISIPVKSEEVYYVGVWVNNTDPDYLAYIGIGATKPDDTIVWSDFVSTDIKDEWVYLSGKYTVPENTKNIFVYLFTNRPFGETGNPTHWSKPLMRHTVSEDLLVEGVIKTEHIAPQAITTPNIAPNAIETSHISVNAVTVDKIAENAITAVKITPNAIESPKIAANAITAAKIATNAITAGKIAANAITAGNIAANAVVSDKIAANAVTAGKIQAGAITTDKIAANAITAVKIATNAVEAGKIQAGAITADKIAANAVTAVKIAANAITAGKISAGAVTANSIAANAVTTNNIAANAIVTNKIATGAITADKISANAITAGKISAGAVGADQLAANAIAAKHLTVGDFTNIIDNGWATGDASGWNMLGNPFALPTPVVNADYYGWTLTSSVGNGATSKAVPVKSGEIYYFGVWINAANNAPTVQLQVRSIKASNTQATTDVATSNVKNQWVYLSGKYTVPEGTKSLQVRLQAAQTAGQPIRTVKWSKPLMRRAVSGELLVDGIIKANHFSTEELITASAQIKNAIITDAKIVDLSAAKLKANTVLAGSIKVEGNTLGSLARQATLIDAIDDDWIKISGADAYSYRSDSATGKRSLISSGSSQAMWLAGANKIPFDPDKTYRVSFRIKRVKANINGTLFLGVIGYKSDGTIINGQGVNSEGSHPFVAKNTFPQNNVPTGWVEYVGYIKGTAQTGTWQQSNNLSSPAKVHKNVRYLAPYVILNYNANFTVASNEAIIAIDRAIIEVMAEDTAALVNAGSTRIDPGQILISGQTSLADWRMGGDTTKINGGHIAANTIAANKLTIGSRGIFIDGLTFEHNKPNLNHVSWTAGTIRFTNDSGTNQNVSIAANSAAWTSGRLYIYWPKGSTSLSHSTDFAVVNQTNNVILASYAGGTNLYANYGRTIIDGNQIKTGSISATQIKAGAISSQQISANAIAAQHISSNAIVSSKIAANAITADKIAAGAITANKIAAGAITANSFAANSIHGDKIQTGTLNANRIAAGTITANHIKAETVDAGNIKPAAITQVVAGTGQQSLWLSLNVPFGLVMMLIKARTSKYLGSNSGGAPAAYFQIYENSVLFASYEMSSHTYVSGESGPADNKHPIYTAGYDFYAFPHFAVSNGYHTYQFWININDPQLYYTNVSVTIMNYKR